MKSKKTQGEIITTVLLILIGIAAVVIVSSFVINMVRDNLKSSDCFKTAGQLKINFDKGYTFFNSTRNQTYLNIERSGEEFNMTGIRVSLGNGATMKTLDLKDKGNGDSIASTMYNGSKTLYVPGPSEAETYIINSTIIPVTKVKITPLIYPNDKACEEGSDEKEVLSKS